MNEIKESEAVKCRCNSMVAAINVDEEPQLTGAEKIHLIPTRVLYRDGKAIDSIVRSDPRRRSIALSRKACKNKEASTMKKQHVYDIIIAGGDPDGAMAVHMAEEYLTGSERGA